MIFAPPRKRRPSRTGTYLLIAVVSSLMTVAIMDKTPVRASSAKETPVIIKMCEPVDAVEACKYIECRAEYEIEGFEIARKPRRD